MSNISSRRRNYLLTPHRRDGLIEWMKSMLMHSFVLDALDTTGADTFSHFEVIIDEHRRMTDQYLLENHAHNSSSSGNDKAMFVPSRLKQLVPQVGTFYTRLPLRKAFEAYNLKYGITKRRHICISFNEIRHILNLAQIIAMTDVYKYKGGSQEGLLPPLVPSVSGDRAGAVKVKREGEKDDQAVKAWTSMTATPRLNDDASSNHSSPNKSKSTPSSSQITRPRGMCDRSDSIALDEAFSLLPDRVTLPGPKLICFDGDQTLYSDGANFESNPKLAKYLFLLLKHGVTIAVVTAAGYEYHAEKYELRLSGLLQYFQDKGLEGDDLERFYIFGGECNYLLRLGADYKLHAVKENGPGGWIYCTKHMSEAPGNWAECEVKSMLDMAEASFKSAMEDQNMRARIIRKKRSVGLVPKADEKITREALDEAVLRIQSELDNSKIDLPFCAFNGGRDAWVDVGNKRVGVQVLQSYLGVPPEESLHIGDQFLNTGNDFAVRSACPCIWVTSPEETSYILKSILRLAGVPLMATLNPVHFDFEDEKKDSGVDDKKGLELDKKVDFDEMECRSRSRTSRLAMDVFTGEMIPLPLQPAAAPRDA